MRICPIIVLRIFRGQVKNVARKLMNFVPLFFRHSN